VSAYLPERMQRLCAALGFFLRGFLGLPPARTVLSSDADEVDGSPRNSAEAARAALVAHANGRQSCC